MPETLPRTSGVGLDGGGSELWLMVEVRGMLGAVSFVLELE